MMLTRYFIFVSFSLAPRREEADRVGLARGSTRRWSRVCQRQLKRWPGSEADCQALWHSLPPDVWIQSTFVSFNSILAWYAIAILYDHSFIPYRFHFSLNFFRFFLLPLEYRVVFDQLAHAGIPLPRPSMPHVIQAFQWASSNKPARTCHQCLMMAPETWSHNQIVLTLRCWEKPYHLIKAYFMWTCLRTAYFVCSH